MSLPDEKYRALVYARDFLRDLLSPEKTKRIPREIRNRAYRCLRHYPWDTDLEAISNKLPDIIKKVD